MSTNYPLIIDGKFMIIRVLKIYFHVSVVKTGFFVYFCSEKKQLREMSTIVIVLLIAIGAVALMMGGLGLKMVLHKEKEFKRPCANADPKTGRCAHCTCGRKK